MESIRIPNHSDIATMSLSVCELERTRLRNEISFARGDASLGGPSGEEIIVACNEAVKVINERMSELRELGDTHGRLAA